MEIISKPMKQRILRAVRASPSLYMLSIRYSRRPYDGSFRRIDRHTDLVIDAYPRSANTYATFAFLSAQQRDVDVAHHFHAPGAVKAAAKRHVPVLTIVRRPEDAVASAMTYRGSSDVGRELDEYLDYYQAVAQCRPAVFVARFESVIEDFGRVTEKFNQRYGTTFEVFDATPDAVAMVQQRIRDIQDSILRDKPADQTRYADLLPVPTEEREARKSILKAKLTESEYSEQLNRARKLYDSLATGADV